MLVLIFMIATEYQNAKMQKCDSKKMENWENMKTRKSNDAEMLKCDYAKIRKVQMPKWKKN